MPRLSTPRRLSALFALAAVLLLAAPVRAQVCSDVILGTQADVDAFACTEVTGDLIISGSISDLSGLDALTSVGGTLYIYSNPALASLSGLGALTSVGGSLYIYSNPALASLSGLDALTSVGRDLPIFSNPVLASLSGLDALTSVGGDLPIFSNPVLASLSGLDALTSVGEDLVIDSNDALASLSGLGALTSVRGRLFIGFNPALASLSGLDALTSVGGELEIFLNPVLASCAEGLAGLISGTPPAFTGVTGSISVFGNPSPCSSPEDILAAFLLLNASPVADAGPDQTVIAGQSVTLDGSASSDPDEDPLTFAWTLASATLSGADTASPSFCAADAVTYTAALVVNDGTVDSEPDDVMVTALSVDDAIGALIADIEAVLSPRDARALTNRLTQALRHLDRGRSADAMFRTVATRIGTYVRIGRLTQPQADALTASLDAITGVLASPCSDVVAVEGDDINALALATEAATFGLSAPYPNPTTGRATLAFGLAEATDVRLAVYDALGRQVALLAEGTRSAGRHELAFDGTDLVAGTYLVRLTTADGQVALHRMTLLR